MTPAINQLIKNKCFYKIHKFEHDLSCLNFGQEAAEKLHINSNMIFKTLIVQTSELNLAVCIIPVKNKLNLKEVANILQVKKAILASKDDAQNSTGYLVGGISPFGQKKVLKTILDNLAFQYETIFVSGGKRGLEIEIKPMEIQTLLNIKIGNIVL